MRHDFGRARGGSKPPSGAKSAQTRDQSSPQHSWIDGEHYGLTPLDLCGVASAHDGVRIGIAPMPWQSVLTIALPVAAPTGHLRANFSPQPGGRASGPAYVRSVAGTVAPATPCPVVNAPNARRTVTLEKWVRDPNTRSWVGRSRQNLFVLSALSWRRTKCYAATALHFYSCLRQNHSRPAPLAP